MFQSQFMKCSRFDLGSDPIPGDRFSPDRSFKMSIVDCVYTKIREYDVFNGR